MSANRMIDIYERERGAVSHRWHCASNADSRMNRSLGWMLACAGSFELRYAVPCVHADHLHGRCTAPGSTLMRPFYAGLPQRALIAVLLAYAAELIAVPMALTLRGGILPLLLCRDSHSLTLQGRIVFRARRCNRDFS